MFTPREARGLRVKTRTLVILVGGVALGAASFGYVWLVAGLGPWELPAILVTLYVTFGFFSAALYTLEGVWRLRRQRDQQNADAVSDKVGRRAGNGQSKE